MRQGINMTKKYQILYMLVAQALATGVSLLLSLIAFLALLDKGIIKEIISCIFVFINGCVIYSYANKFAWYDLKEYTHTKAEPLKGIWMGLIISLSMIVAFVLLKLSWLFGSDPAREYLTSGFAVAGNAIFLLWTFPYYGILGMSHGYITCYATILLFIFPPICSYSGYMAGLKGFNVLEKIYKFTYVQKKTDKTTKK